VTEKELQANVEEMARYLGWKVYHTRNSRGSAAGFPDLIMLRGRWMMAWELKTAKGAATPDQQAWLDAFSLAGALALVMRPDDWHSGRIEGLLR
jgi:hypothetical protein